MEELCISAEQIEEVVIFILSRHPHCTRNEIENAIRKCCESSTNPIDLTDFKKCVERIAKFNHLANYKI